jgi:general secretion pathway protein D
VRTRAPLLALVLLPFLLAAADEPSAWELYERGRSAEKAGRMVEAYLMYSEAAAMEPKNQTYWFRSQAVRSRAALQALPVPKLPQGESDPADVDAAGQAIEEATPQDRIEARKPLPPTELAAQSGAKDLDFRGDFKQLWEETSHAFGLDCVFDADYAAGRSFRFQLKDVDYRDAIHGLEAATNSFIVPVNNKIFMVVKDTPQKREELEPKACVTVEIPDATSQQDLTEILRDVQQAMGLEKVSMDSANHTVILKDRVSKLLPARVLLEDLMHPRAQVSIELKVLEVSRNDVITYGIDFPTLFSLSPLTTWLNNQLSTPGGVVGLLAFGGGKTLMGIGIMNPAMVANMSKSSGQSLLDADIRSEDGLPATMHIGERYPILSSGYYGPQSFQGTGGATAYTPPPSFNFTDLGLTLKVTPKVHSSLSVSLDIDAAFQMLTGQSINGIPVVSNRSVKEMVQLKFGEWAMVAGLIDSNDAHIVAGLAGLSHVPVLGALTSTHEHDSDSDQVLILMRPILLSLPPSESPTHSVRVGTDTRPLTPL